MQRRARINKAAELPTTGDLQKISTFVKKEITAETSNKSTDYCLLQKLLMTSLIIFNKRRPAEVGKIKVGEFRIAINREEDQEEVLQCLTPEEKAVAGR